MLREIIRLAELFAAENAWLVDARDWWFDEAPSLGED